MGDKVALAGLIVAVLALPAAYLAVPDLKDRLSRLWRTAWGKVWFTSYALFVVSLIGLLLFPGLESPSKDKKQPSELTLHSSKAEADSTVLAQPRPHAGSMSINEPLSRGENARNPLSMRDTTKGEYTKEPAFSVVISHSAMLIRDQLLIDGRQATIEDSSAPRFTRLSVTQGRHTLEGTANGKKCEVRFSVPAEEPVPLQCE